MGQQYGFDGFGNLLSKTVTSGSGPSLSQSVNPANNWIVGGSYDANGNTAGLVNAGLSYSLGYDPENRLAAAYVSSNSGNYIAYAYAKTRKTMKRKDLIRHFVLNEIGDDYENLEHIGPLIAKEASRCGLDLSELELVQGLVELIEAGLAKAYILTPTRRAAEEYPGVPPLDGLGEYYFWATAEGMELQASDGDWYPFEDNGELRKGWTAPEI